MTTPIADATYSPTIFCGVSVHFAFCAPPVYLRILGLVLVARIPDRGLDSFYLLSQKSQVPLWIFAEYLLAELGHLRVALLKK